MGDLSNVALWCGLLLFVLGIFAWGYYTGVDSERRRKEEPDGSHRDEDRS